MEQVHKREVERFYRYRRFRRALAYAAAFDEFVCRGEASELIAIFGGHIAGDRQHG